MSYQNQYMQKLHKVRNIVSIKELIDSGARMYGADPAFLIKDEKGGPYQEVSHAELKADVDALGTRLIDLGLSGKPIAIIGENSYRWIVSYFAVINIGIAVPLDKELSQKEILNLVRTAECCGAFYAPAFSETFDSLEMEFLCSMFFYRKEDAGDRNDSWEGLIRDGRRLIEEGDTRFTGLSVDPEEMKVLLFTSGTTDAAKAVMLCHRNLVSNIINTSRIFKINRTDRTLSILPIHHTFESTIDIMVALFQGASVAFYEGLKYIVKNLSEAKCSILVAVPLVLESIHDKIWKQAEKAGKAKMLKFGIFLHKLLSAVGIDVSRKLFRTVYESFGGNLRMLINGAAAINPLVLRGFHDLGFEVAQGYGLTESAPLLAGTPDFTKRHKKTASVGPVIPDGELEIINRNEEGIGEIIYRGPNVMMGYYRMPELTREVLRDGWLYTGDLGYVDKDGWLYITGRKKNVIVTKTGKNIYPEEIEQYLNRLPYIKESMVFGLDGDSEEGTVVSAQVRPEYEVIYEEYGKDFSDEQVYTLIRKEIAEMNQTIPNYKRVRHIKIRLEEFVKTTTQKIRRKENMC